MVPFFLDVAGVVVRSDKYLAIGNRRRGRESTPVTMGKNRDSLRIIYLKVDREDYTNRFAFDWKLLG